VSSTDTEDLINLPRRDLNIFHEQEIRGVVYRKISDREIKLGMAIALVQGDRGYICSYDPNTIIASGVVVRKSADPVPYASSPYQGPTMVYIAMPEDNTRNTYGSLTANADSFYIYPWMDVYDIGSTNRGLGPAGAETKPKEKPPEEPWGRKIKRSIQC